MKSLKLFVIILSFSVFTSVTTFANNSVNTKIKESLRTEIVSLIGKELPIKLDKNFSTEVQFTVNKKNEIVILDIDLDHDELILHLKKRLNYKKVNSKNIKVGKVYTLPLKINKAS